MAENEIRTTTFRLEIHLFKGEETTPVVQIWEKVEANKFPNPLMLKAYGGWDGDREYLFSLADWNETGAIATYHPFATHEKQSFIKDLPFFGFREV